MSNYTNSVRMPMLRLGRVLCIPYRSDLLTWFVPLFCSGKSDFAVSLGDGDPRDRGRCVSLANFVSQSAVSAPPLVICFINQPRGKQRHNQRIQPLCLSLLGVPSQCFRINISCTQHSVNHIQFIKLKAEEGRSRRVKAAKSVKTEHICSLW